jgi:hypothetical protein
VDHLPLIVKHMPLLSLLLLDPLLGDHSRERSRRRLEREPVMPTRGAAIRSDHLEMTPPGQWAVLSVCSPSRR